MTNIKIQQLHHKKHDLDAVLELDRFSFAMEVCIENNFPVLHAIVEDGEIF